MHRFTALGALLWALLALTALGAQADLSDEELLQQMDFQRFGGYITGEAPTTSFTVEIVAQRPDGSKQAVVQVSFHLALNLFRIDYLSPEELVGDVFIVTSEEVFFWNPDLLEPLKVNGRFEVFGDATVAEVVGIFFQGSYAVAQRDAITLNDGAPALRLALTATSEAVAFPRAEVTADAQTLRPINLKLFDESGDLLHDNTFTAYAEVNGVPYFETQLLDNQIVPVNQTLLTITNIQNREIDPATFDPTRLGG